MISFISLNTIVTDLLNTVRGAKVSQSETISRRQIEDWVNQYRALLIKRDLDNNKMPNPDYIQEIPSLELEVVDKTLGTDIESSTYHMRSKLIVPKLIDLNFKSGIMYLGTLDGKEIQFVPEGRSYWQKYKRFTSKDSLSFLRNRHVYVDNVSPLAAVAMRGLFEIPMEVYNLINPAADPQTYETINDKYPIPINMVPALKEMILQKELGIIAQAPSDNKNDGANIMTSNAEQKR